MPYPALNSAFDALFPKGIRQYWKADFVRDLPDEAIAAHVEHGPRVPTVARPCTSTRSTAPPAGWAPRRRRSATATRGTRWSSPAFWPDPADDDADIPWVRDYYAAVHPYSGT